MARTVWCFFSLLFCWLALLPAHIGAETKPLSENHFPLLPGLEDPVEFWKKIFTEYTTSQVIFFDPLEMSKIYEVVDVGEEDRSKKFIDHERERIATANGVDLDRVVAQRGVKERTIAGLQRSGRYMARIQQIFQAKNLPLELSYLPLVESSFDIDARSYAGAVGMWQFMRSTGRRFLRISRHIDERKDPIESSRAAASLLLENYQTLGNWPLAITAYNFGAAGLARAVAKLQSDDLVEIIKHYNHRHWGFAPKNFYAEFLAAVDIATNVDHYFPGLEFHPPLALREVELKKPVSVASMLKTTGLNRHEFLQWNPALSRRVRFIPSGYRVKVPADRKPQLVLAAQHGPQEPPLVRHRVRRGETLSQIARRYRASLETILEINGLRRPNFIRAGTLLLIPKL
jgi:membrane-bound lytic murein transglycosylase D